MNFRPMIFAAAALVAAPLADFTIASGSFNAVAEAQGRGRDRDTDRGRGRARGRDRDTDTDRRRARDRDTDTDRRRARDRDTDTDRRLGRDRDTDTDNRGSNRGRGRGCIDIDRDGRCDPANTVCRDTNGDGLCDRRGRGPNDDDLCVDRNRDGRCDIAGALPDMIGAIILRDGRTTRMSREWLADRGVRRVRYFDRDRNGVPERAVFLDAAGRIVQAWWDINGDGRADRVQTYRNGRPHRVFGV